MIDQRPFRILTSFHYCRDKDLGELARKHWPDARVEMFGDSGAFSAANAGAQVDVGAYAEWLGVNAKHLRVYANLDVIGSVEGTARNQRELERRGFSPLPVFHLGSPLPELERLIDAGYPYIALGGMVGKNKDLLMRYAIQCFKLARAKGKGTQFHGFGLTSIRSIVNLPWYSVDSTTWLRGTKFGELDLFDPTIVNLRRAKMFTSDVDDVARLIRTYGSDPAIYRTRAAYKASNGYKRATALHFRTWLSVAEFCRRRHGDVTFPGNRDLAGLHLYVVDSGTFSYFRIALAALGLGDMARARAGVETAPGGAAA